MPNNKMNLSNTIKLAHKYNLRTLRELEILIFIIDNIDYEPITIKLIMERLKYPYTSVKKVIYKLGMGRESGYDGYSLITYRKSYQIGGTTKFIKLTAKGKRFAEKLNDIK